MGFQVYGACRLSVFIFLFSFGGGGEGLGHARLGPLRSTWRVG